MIIEFKKSDGSKLSATSKRHDDINLGILEVNGIDTLSNSLTIKDYANGDGAYLVAERVPKRDIELTLITRTIATDAYKKAFLSFFNVKDNFIINIVFDSYSRWINAKLAGLKMDLYARDYYKIKMSFVCVDPFFNSADNFGKNIAAVVGNFGFPYMRKIDEQWSFSDFAFNKSVTVENNGDVETNMLIRLKFSGDVENPKITNGTHYIRLIDNMVAGDEVVIDMENNTITKNGVNCIRLVDRTSSFSGMKIKQGDNTIGYEADNGDAAMSVSLYYNLKYLGA